MTSLNNQREEEKQAFLKSAGWADARRAPITGDASTRSYERLILGDQRAVLMNAPPAAETASCPRGAGPAERRALGYNAMARLAGPNMHAFLAVDEALRAAGLSAPEIYAADPAAGFALIEDLGDDLFARTIPDGADEETLYAAAVDALLELARAAPQPPDSDSYAMLAYDLTAMEAEIALLPEWYWRLLRHERPQSSIEAEYFAAWAPVLEKLSVPGSIVLRDYHAENLLWLPERSGAKRVGVIDFQDGLVGQPAYDLVSLLEDARRDVSPALADSMIKRYCEGARGIGGFDEAQFRADYAILAAQRNAKILGIFARLVERDGKPRYRDFLPRVEAHFRKDLDRPELAEVRNFFRRHLPELSA